MELAISRKYRYKKEATQNKSKHLLFLLKRLSQGLSCVIIFFAVGYAVFWCLDPSHFPITSVRFIGERKNLSQEELRTAFVSEVNAGFFRLNVSTLQHQLLSLPWIKQADVRKVWPDQLVVRFEEHTPAAYWSDKGMISDMGTVFYPDISKVSDLNLPILQGPDGRQALVWQQLLVMEETLAPLNLTITHLTLAPRGAWHLRLSNGMMVILGTNDILKRLNRFVQAYDKHLSARAQEMSYVDLRYTSGMTVGWRSV